MKQIIYNAYRHFVLRGIKNFNKPSNPQEWKLFLSKLPQATSRDQRSLNKYFCRMYYFGLGNKILLNLAAIGGVVFTVIPSFIRPNTEINKCNADAVLVEKNISYSDIIPGTLIEEYPNIKVVNDERKNLKLNGDAKKIFMRIWRKNLFRPYYVLWIFRELAFISKLVDTYSPKAIIVYVYERSVASPLITDYLEAKGIKFISFMHGDYTMQLIHAYTEFSEYYMWDSHYVDLWSNDLYCPPNQFRLYRPRKLQKKYSSSNETVDFTYYLGSESDLTLERLGQLYKSLRSIGVKCKVRRHPRRFNLEQIAKYFDENQIENPEAVTIDESISRSEYIVSLNSTVMSEAYYGGKKIILDDWTDPKKYQSYVSRKGITATKHHMLLSEYISELKNNYETFRI